MCVCVCVCVCVCGCVCVRVCTCVCVGGEGPVIFVVVVKDKIFTGYFLHLMCVCDSSI